MLAAAEMEGPQPPKNFDDWREQNGCAFVPEADMRAAAPVLRALLACCYTESGADTVERIEAWAKEAGVDVAAIDQAWHTLGHLP